MVKETQIEENQPTINIGTIGHVAHGKSTLVRALTGTKTVRFKSELERNITIKLGYANAKIYKCKTCPRPGCYQSNLKQKKDQNKPDTNKLRKKCVNEGCSSEVELVKHVSFVDCPGHDVLMATMLSGASIMDFSILLVGANEPCPQPQTKEHLFAVEIMNLTNKTSKSSNIVVVQNKVDLVTREQALEHEQQISAFMEGSSVGAAYSRY